MGSLISHILSIVLNKCDLFIWSYKTIRSRNFNISSESKTLMISCLATIIATAKFESLISYYLKRRGYKVYVLLPSQNKDIERIFSAFGQVTFLYLDKFSTQSLVSRKTIDNLFSSEINRKDFLNFEIDGVRIGKNTLSKTVRHFRIGQIDWDSNEHIEYLKNVIFDSLFTINAFKQILLIHKFDKAIFSERGYTPSGEIFDLCILNNIDVIQWISSPTPDSFAFKRYNLYNKNMHPLSMSKYNFDKLTVNRALINTSTSILSYLEKLYSTDGTYNYQELNNGKKIISDVDSLNNFFGFINKNKIAVIFCHILYDATFFYGESIYENYQTWLIETVRIAIDNSNVNWIIKVHPVNVWRSKMDGVIMEQLEKRILEDHFGVLPSHIKFLSADTPLNTFSLFKYIDFGLTVRGTVGIELPCFDIPVITSGTGRYDNMGFTIDADSKEKYEYYLMNLHKLNFKDFNLSSNKAILYLYTMLNLRSVKMEYIKIKMERAYFFTKRKVFKLYINNLFYSKIDLNLASVVKWIDEGTDEEYLKE